MKKLKITPFFCLLLLLILQAACKKCYYCEKNGARVSPTVCSNENTYQAYKDNCDWYNGFCVKDK